MIFLYQPAADGSVDPEWELRTNDYTDTRISIQDCRSYGGGYAVNEMEADSVGNIVASTMVAFEIRTLNAAKKIALAYAAKHGWRD